MVIMSDFDSRGEIWLKPLTTLYYVFIRQQGAPESFKGVKLLNFPALENVGATFNGKSRFPQLIPIESIACLRLVFTMGTFRFE